MQAAFRSKIRAPRAMHTSWQQILSAEERLCGYEREADSQKHQSALHLQRQKHCRAVNGRGTQQYDVLHSPTKNWVRVDRELSAIDRDFLSIGCSACVITDLATYRAC